MAYDGYPSRHLHQRVAEHISLNSSVGKDMHDMHGVSKPNSITHQFLLLNSGNVDHQDLKPNLNVQSDSILAKLFTWSQKKQYVLYCVHSFVFRPRRNRQSFCLDSSIIETSERISFNICSDCLKVNFLGEHLYYRL